MGKSKKAKNEKPGHDLFMHDENLIEMTQTALRLKLSQKALTTDIHGLQKERQ